MFKKITQITWILIAVAFLVIMTYIAKADFCVFWMHKDQNSISFYKVNKLTGEIQARLIVDGIVGDWWAIETTEGEKKE